MRCDVSTQCGVLVGGLLLGLLLVTVVAFAEDTKKEDTTKADLVACQAQVKATEAVLVGVAQGIQKEMELASFRLEATKGSPRRTP